MTVDLFELFLQKPGVALDQFGRKQSVVNTRQNSFFKLCCLDRPIVPAWALAEVSAAAPAAIADAM
ncbi:hypothetical protein ABVV53_03250 [Novosphingobium sp. RD2P27]|uniref:Uncharacterized protein n=1 Tax=Novosphingobium kalidii TaxID=3230299 RepID=A0ABV2CY05_9SPHN